MGLPYNVGGPEWSNSWTAVPGGLKTKVGLAAASLDGALGIETGIALALTGEAGNIHINYLDNGGWLGWNAVPGMHTKVGLCAAVAGGTLHLYAAGEDENVYYNSTTDGSTWSRTWTQVPGAKTKTALCAGADGSLYLVGLHGGVWVNPNPPAGDWTQLVIQGNAFHTEAGLCSVETFTAGEPPSLFAKGQDDEIWCCYPPGQGWSQLGSLGGSASLTYVGIAGVSLLDFFCCLFMTGRHNEIYFSDSYTGSLTPWTIIPGFKTHVQLAAAATSSVSATGGLTLADVYLFATGVDEGDVQYMVGQWGEA